MGLAWKNILLVLGAVVVVSSALFTLMHLTDRTVFAVLVPGFLLGMAMIVGAIHIGRGPRHGLER